MVNGQGMGEALVAEEGVRGAGVDGEREPSRAGGTWGRRERLSLAMGGDVRGVNGEVDVTGRDEIRAHSDGHGQLIAERPALAGWPGVEPVEKHAPPKRLGPLGISPSGPHVLAHVEPDESDARS